MARKLDTKTLQAAVRDYAGEFLRATVWSPTRPDHAIAGRDWVIRSMFRFHFKDEFEYIRKGLEGYLGHEPWSEFKAATKGVFKPRSDDLFAELLEEKLAIRPDGTAIPDKLGTVQIGQRTIGWRPKEIRLGTGRRSKTVVLNKPILAPVFAGDPTWHQSVGATVMNISSELAITGLDAIVDHLDSDGSSNAVITGRTGSQPADPDVSATGTLLFTLAMSATSFGAASDQTDGTADAVAASISDDTSADATGTLGYCRVSSTNDGSTPVDDHIDGEAGTSGADFNFNTLSIVSGATVSMTAYTITMPQGSTAT